MSLAKSRCGVCFGNHIPQAWMSCSELCNCVSLKMRRMRGGRPETCQHQQNQGTDIAGCSPGRISCFLGVGKVKLEFAGADTRLVGVFDRAGVEILDRVQVLVSRIQEG